MKKLRIGYFADGIWSHRAFEKIISDPLFEIAFIIPRLNSTDTILRSYSIKHGIPYFETNNVNSDEFLERVFEYHCDIFVSMSYDQIFKKEIINLPPLKIINCHAGKLPFYRGRNILNWALINDEKEFGITVHYVDCGIDTGDIILQRIFPISDEDNYSTLLETAYNECAEILYDALVLLREKIFKPTPQKTIHPLGFYCGIRTAGDEQVIWNQPSRVVFNFIRAICKPGPMATTYHEHNEVKINRSAMISNAPNYIGIPGQVVGKTGRGLVVKTADSTVEVYDIYTLGKIKIGDRLK